MNLIKTVLKGMTQEDNHRLKELYATGNTIPKEDFNKLFSAESVRKEQLKTGYGG